MQIRSHGKGILCAQCHFIIREMVQNLLKTGRFRVSAFLSALLNSFSNEHKKPCFSLVKKKKSNKTLHLQKFRKNIYRNTFRSMFSYLLLASQNIKQTENHFVLILRFCLHNLTFLTAVGCYVGVCLCINVFFQACACC